MGLFNRLFGKKKNESSDNMLSPREFYTRCVEDYHNTAAKHGLAKKGLVLIPELVPIGQKTVLAFLKDVFFQTEFRDDAALYHYVIMSLSLQAGIVFAAKWHEDFAGLDDAFVDQIIVEGPADACKPCLRKLGLTDNEKENEFYRAIFQRWLALHEPYWKLSDPREYTFNAMLAAYQLGISLILCECGYGRV